MPPLTRRLQSATIELDAIGHDILALGVGAPWSTPESLRLICEYPEEAPQTPSAASAAPVASVPSFSPDSQCPREVMRGAAESSIITGMRHLLQSKSLINSSDCVWCPTRHININIQSLVFVSLIKIAKHKTYRQSH